jgi:hypothetical protein
MLLLSWNDDEIVKIYSDNKMLRTIHTREGRGVCVDRGAVRLVALVA